ncbi:MAG: adenylyl-sulfate reductase subunit alpha [Clostridiales bacterium]|nr:adenylyl-sulfate reductase subunit alpha [Clostridiales bacterium]
MPFHIVEKTADILIIGGGTAGCYAALTLAAHEGLSVLIAEKANIRRSGCLAAGVNAINAYIPAGKTPEDYLEYVRWDAAGIIRDDLVLSMARRFNSVVGRLEDLGLVILKDETGAYALRGQWNIKINGENIKPLLSQAVYRAKNVEVLNHVNITDYLILNGRVVGAAGFSVREETAYFLRARAVICTAGGAAGLYRPNNPGFSQHKMWYPPFNTGTGYALGIRAGAEMTTFEMRFVAQRCKDTIAPTGTIALGVGAKQVNAQGEEYTSRYGLSTSGRAYGTTNETHQGRGPCYLNTIGITSRQDEDLLKAYLNMAPSQTLKWLESGKRPSQQNVELEGTEPYVVGGHTASGYWVDTGRRTTLRGLYAAGDVAGGAPKKFVTGALAEGEIAANTALADLPGLPLPEDEALQAQEQAILQTYEQHLTPADTSTVKRYSRHFVPPCRYTSQQLEEAMQKVMDDYAGGIHSSYRYSEAQLDIADERLEGLTALAQDLRGTDTDDLLHIYELKDRLLVCQSLIAHLRARRETRWAGFGFNTDYPGVDDSWQLYVNSRLENGTLKIHYRNLVKEAITFEYPDSNG